jgi:hypothetical protein
MQPICIHKKNVVPANLNALIRYKTMDSCLSNPYRKWTIGDLTEACSHALKENRGMDTGVSERTIREDIRVMRSDILGFNAPIVQKEGNYYYEDPGYSIFNVGIQDEDLLQRVLDFMLEIRSEVSHPEMDRIIELLSKALPEIGSARETGPGYDDLERDSSFLSAPAPLEESIDFRKAPETGDELFGEELFLKEPDAPRLQWSLILALI